MIDGWVNAGWVGWRERGRAEVRESVGVGPRAKHSGANLSRA